LARLEGRDLAQTDKPGAVFDFVMAFARSAADIARLAQKAAACLGEDGLLWFAYPKKASKRYRTDISRDDGWLPLGELGFKAVRQIAVDADWSALRFRQVGHIKTLQRKPARAMTSEGKKQAGG